MPETSPRELTPEEVALTGVQSGMSRQSSPLLVPPGSSVSVDKIAVTAADSSPPTTPTQHPPKAA